MKMDGDQITRVEAARILEVSASAVDQMLRAGRLPRTYPQAPSLSRAVVEELALERALDVDQITHAEAGRILGLSVSRVNTLIGNGRLPSTYPHYHHGLSREVVEAIALATWNRRRAAGGYWVTSAEAARLLGVSRQRLAQLSREGRLPTLVVTRKSRQLRVYRRAQLEVIARARRARWHGEWPAAGPTA